MAFRRHSYRARRGLTELQPLIYAAMVRTCSAMMGAETIAPVSAFGGRSAWNLIAYRVRWRVDPLSINIRVGAAIKQCDRLVP